MENYEQKYKEALSWAHSAIKAGADGMLKEDLERVFPELRESEDERIRKGLIKGLSAMRDIHKHQTFSDDAINIDDAIAWLEKQGEQKPSWSEEDEKFYISALWHIKNSCGNGGKDSGEYEVYNWLKSIKPNHWKPSEEQMKALETTIHISNFGLDIDRLRMLESLYNDLKKL